MIRLRVKNSQRVVEAIESIAEDADLGPAVEAGHAKLIDVSNDFLSSLGWGRTAQWSEPSAKRNGDSWVSVAVPGESVYDWVDLGTDPVTIEGKFMRFMSEYEAKSDGGSGEYKGAVIRTKRVRDRQIKARKLTDQTLEKHTDDIFEAMIDALKF